MIGAVIFVIFFMLFLAITTGMPELPPGNTIQTEILQLPQTTYPVLGIPGWILINAILNGVIYGFAVWLIYSVVSLATRSRRKKEQYPPTPPPQYPPQQYPPPQYAPPPARPATQFPQPTYSPPAQPTYAPPPSMPPPQHTPPPGTAQPQPPAPTVTAPVSPAIEEFSVSSENLVDKVTELLRQGNLTKIIIRDEKGKVLLEIPATVGVAGATVAPWLAGLGAIAALATRCTISVVRPQQ